MKDGIPLVVPEVNPEQIHKHNGLIANPNCSTIIMNVPVWPLHKVNRVKRIIVSTYQAVSGAGAWGLYELEKQMKAYAAAADQEGKVPAPDRQQPLLAQHEGRRERLQRGREQDGQRDAEDLRRPEDHGHRHLHPRADPARPQRIDQPRVRAPDHAEQVREILSKAPGVKIVDDRENNHFPMPLEASGQDDVLVGRIRQDISRDDGRGIELFVSGDQIRKGAATNAVQIAPKLPRRLIPFAPALAPSDTSSIPNVAALETFARSGGFQWLPICSTRPNHSSSSCIAARPRSSSPARSRRAMRCASRRFARPPAWSAPASRSWSGRRPPP
jgi:aspartate-semialdehyde dehydrogenase